MFEVVLVCIIISFLLLIQFSTVSCTYRLVFIAFLSSSNMCKSYTSYYLVSGTSCTGYLKYI